MDLLELLARRPGVTSTSCVRSRKAVLEGVAASAPATANAARSAPPGAMATGRGAGTRAPAASELQLPKLRQGSYFLRLWSPGCRRDRAPPRRRGRRTVEGCSRHAASTTSYSMARCRICAELHGVVASFLERSIDGGPYRYLWLDALTQRVREEGRIAQVSVVVATAVNADGAPHCVGTSEGGRLDFSAGWWRAGSPGTRDLRRPQWPQGGVATVFGGASWALQDALPISDAGTEEHEATGPISRCARRGRAALAGGGARPQARVVEQLDERFPAAAAMLDEAAPSRRPARSRTGSTGRRLKHARSAGGTWSELVLGGSDDEWAVAAT